VFNHETLCAILNKQVAQSKHRTYTTFAARSVLDVNVSDKQAMINTTGLYANSYNSLLMIDFV